MCSLVIECKDNLRVLVMLLDDRDIDNSQEQLDQQLHPDVGQLAHQPPDLNSILVCTSERERERETDRQRERERERDTERQRERALFGAMSITGRHL